MHRALGILEIVTIILEGEENTTWRPQALVCKQWSEICLDGIWENVGDRTVLDLLKILGPVTEVDSDASEGADSEVLNDSHFVSRCHVWLSPVLTASRSF